MKLGNLLKVALKSMLKNRMRSLLTMLGIIIGVASVIAMISVGEGAQSSVEGQITSLGTNLLIIMPGSSSFGRIHRGAGSLDTLTWDDCSALTSQTGLIQYVSPVVRVNGQIIAGRNNWYASILGVSDTYLNIRDWKLEDGMFFTDRDIRSRRKVAVLGQTVAENLFPGQSPVGARIRIRNVPFTVIGVLEEKGQSATGMDSDDVVLAPSTTVSYRLSDGKNIGSIMVSAVSMDVMDETQAEITAILRRTHRLHEGQEDDFNIRSQTEIAQMATDVTGTFTMLLAAIAGVSLLVGGIGIMNIMLVSVTERTREIGIRLAVGARESDVMVQFLIEAVLLCMIGGILGVAAGFGIGYLLCQAINLKLAINPAVVVLSFLFSGAVGVFFGFYPARKAATLDPIEALRYE
ncbi:ABC transporter permease [bacterium]|nr:ABC transporter permease [candidate division CSSED10-310 bacterium]